MKKNAIEQLEFHIALISQELKGNQERLEQYKNALRYNVTNPSIDILMTQSQLSHISEITQQILFNGRTLEILKDIQEKNN